MLLSCDNVIFEDCHYYFHFRDFSLLEEYYLFVIVNDVIA